MGMNRKIDKNIIRGLLPAKVKKYCLIGICNPKYLDDIKPIYSIKNKKWSANPRELFHNLKSIIVLIHFTPRMLDYRVEKIIVKLGSLLQKRLGVKTHIINESGKADPTLLVGTEWGLSSKRYDKLILLKELAYYAGLGQYGKNTLIITPQFGSSCKIQTLFTKEELEYDSPMIPKKYPGCKDCNQCIELCPNGALSDYHVDVLKCEGKIVNPYLFSLHFLRKPKLRKYRIQYENCRNCQIFCKADSDHYIKLEKRRDDGTGNIHKHNIKSEICK